MNTPRIIAASIGLGSVLALGLGPGSSSATAGPGPDYRQKIEQIRTENQAMSDHHADHARTPAPAAAPAKADKTDRKQMPPACAQHQKCGCAAVAAKKTKP